MQIKLRFSYQSIKEMNVCLEFKLEKKLSILTNSNFTLNFLLYCFTLNYKIFFKILKPKIKMKYKTSFLEKKTFNFFLKSIIRIITDFLFNFGLSFRFDSLIFECRKHLYTFSHMSSKFLYNENKFKINQKTLIGKTIGKNNKLKKKLDYFSRLKTTSSKNFFLMENDLKQIRFFISENLGKLTSILDINISRQSESVEQISDHSIGMDKNLDKIKKKLNLSKNIKKKFTFFERKTVFLSIISFLLCNYLF